MSKYRTKTCGELTLNNLDETVTLAGFVMGIRDHGGVMFVDLRDHYGITQIVIHDDSMLKNVSKETVIQVTGKVIKRDEETINETLELEGVTLTINGIVSKPDTTEGLYTYYSEFRDFEEYLPKMEFLFGEYQDRMYLDGELYYRVDVPEIEYWAYLFAMPKDGYVSYLRATVPVLEDEVAVNLTNEEAISMANDILDEIGVPEVELHTCDYEEEVLQITPDGELSGALGDRLNVDYFQYLQGVPVMSTLFELDVKTRVVFWSRGLFEVTISISD